MLRTSLSSLLYILCIYSALFVAFISAKIVYGGINYEMSTEIIIKAEPVVNYECISNGVSNVVYILMRNDWGYIMLRQIMPV